MKNLWSQFLSFYEYERLKYNFILIVLIRENISDIYINEG
jgi:hypothetical protein